MTGAVLGSGGTLLVESPGRRHRLEVDRGTCETRIAGEATSDVILGTAITAHFGPGLPGDTDPIAWESCERDATMLEPMDNFGTTHY